jgi:hypothetical protein
LGSSETLAVADDLMNPDWVIEARQEVAHYPGEWPDIRHGRNEIMPQ